MMNWSREYSILGEVSLYGWSTEVWSDLAKFYHFGTILKVLGKFLKVYLVFGKLLIFIWRKCYAIGQVFGGIKFQK